MTLLLAYLRDPSVKLDKSVRQSAFKYVLYNDELYPRTAEDLQLKCLDSDQARVAMCWQNLVGSLLRGMPEVVIYR
jgi:hypothetical protein